MPSAMRNQLSEPGQRRSIFFQLRAALCFVTLGLLVFHRQQLSPLLWGLGIFYLVSNLVVRVLPTSWFKEFKASYAIFLLDMAGMSIVLYSVAGFGSDSLLLFYLTVFMATLGESVTRSLGVAFGASALYIWLHVDTLLTDAESLLRIPLFLTTALLCGYLVQELRQHKRHVQNLQDTQKDLELQVGSISNYLTLSEESKTVAQELARRFRSLLEDLRAVVWEMSVPDFQVSFVSPEAERLLGYPVERWLSEKDFWVNHIHAGDRERVLETCQKALAEGRDYHLEYRVSAADGRVVWLQDIVRVLRDESGKVRLLRGVMVDITVHKQLEEELRQAQRIEAVGRLAGGVAHDFNNLLTIIDGYSQLALDLVPAGQGLHDHLTEIQKASRRASALTRRLLAFSRRQALQPQVLDLNAVVADMEKMLRRLIGEDIELVTVQQPGLGAVRADPAQIEQVMLNLAVNARDAMPHGGKLIIETANQDFDESYARSHVAFKPGSYVMLAVNDTGVGMDEYTRAHIFEPFFTTKEKGKGTGLGLATVYGIVKQSDGYIWVYSEPGQGTSFKIYLPRRVEVPMAFPKVAAPRIQLKGSETVLVVEDEDGVRTFVCGILKSAGYSVLGASRPDEALRLCQQFDGGIQLLITDVVMPQMNGRELAERLKTMRPETRVLYMSGYTDAAIMHHGVLEPAVAFLQKPFTPDALARKVREVLDAVLKT
jgi:PAS domain S-box-containing protein